MRTLIYLACWLGVAHADWTLTSGLLGPDVQSLLLQGDTLFAGTVTGLYQSKDEGNHWTACGLRPSVRSLIAQGNAKLAATDSGVFRRREGETAWQKAQMGLEDTVGVALAAMGPWVFAGNDRGVFRSSDQGNTWTLSVTGLYDLPVTSFHAYETELYVGTNAGRVFRSVDSGATWATVGPAPNHVLSVQRLGRRLFIRNRYGIAELAEDASAWDMRFEEKRGAMGGPLFEVDGSVLYTMGSHGLHRSSDSGLTWRQVSAQLGTGCEPVRMIRKGSRLFAATELGMFRSADEGRTWAGVNRGLATLIYERPVSLGPRLLLATEKGLFSTVDEGETWARMDSGDWAPNYHAPWYQAIAEGDGALWACFSKGDIQGVMAMSQDSGRSWTPRPITLESYDAWAQIEMISVQGGTLFAARDFNGQNPEAHRLYRSRDRGLTWEESGTGLVKAYTTDMLSLGDTLFLATWAGVFRSANGGLLWAPTGAMAVESGVNSLAKLGSLLFAATNKGLYRSRDRGASWARIDQGVFKDSVLYRVIAAGDKLFVSGWATGIHMSADSGNTWTPLEAPTEAIGYSASFRLIAAHGNALYASGNGIWRMPLSGSPVQVTPGARRTGRNPRWIPGATPHGQTSHRLGEAAVDAQGRRLPAKLPAKLPRTGGQP